MKRKYTKKRKYEVFGCALGKFTATTNARSNQASKRDYRTFDTRAEAERWAAEMNASQSR